MTGGAAAAPNGCDAAMTGAEMVGLISMDTGAAAAAGAACSIAACFAASFSAILFRFSSSSWRKSCEKKHGNTMTEQHNIQHDAECIVWPA